MKTRITLALAVLIAVSAYTLATPASAQGPICVPVPDLDGHVWTLCLPAR